MDRPSAYFLAISITAALGAGCLMALQPAVNAKLSSQCSHPLQASIISFATGFLALFCLGCMLQVGFPSLQSLSKLPWWAWCGGLIGTYMVTVSLIIAPGLGATRWIALVVAGQIGVSLLLDNYGLIGYAQQSFNWTRLLGAALIVLGVILVMRN